MSELYKPDELGELFGLNPRHLTREDGPISRILSTYHWKSAKLSPDGKSLTEEGVTILNEYLTECGKNGKTDFKKWQQNIWEKHGKAPNSESAIIPLVDVTVAELSPVNFGDYFGGTFSQSFEATVTALAEANYQKGRELARKLVTPLYQGFAEEYQNLNQQGLEFVSKMGGK